MVKLIIEVFCTYLKVRESHLLSFILEEDKMQAPEVPKDFVQFLILKL